MASPYVDAGNSSMKKRSNEDGDDPDGKRLKPSPGDPELSLRGGSGDPASKRGVARGPTDEEWEELLSTGIMTGVEDLQSSPLSSKSDVSCPDELEEPTRQARGNGRGSTFGGDPVDPIPINLPRSTPAKSVTSAKSEQSSTARPPKVSKTTQAKNPAKPTPGKDFQFSDDFQASTPNVGAGGGRGNNSPPSSPPSPSGDGSFSSSPRRRQAYDFTQDEVILKKWKSLETMIEQYVEECIEDTMPEEVESTENSPYEVFRWLFGGETADEADDMAAAMCHNANYAPYVFQITIWNYLLSALFSRGSHHWAADMHQQNGSTSMSQGCGLGIATDAATNQVIFSGQAERTYENCMEFFVFRKETCDYIYEYLVNNDNYAKHFNEICRELIFLFAGHFKPEYAWGNEESWTELLRLTTDVVSTAWNLAILMRRADGVWDAFIPKPTLNQALDMDCVELHQRADLAQPSGQGGILPTSGVTLTVVPGLVKHDIVRDRSRGPDGCRLRTMRRVCAKVFVDLKLSDLVQ